MTIIPGNKKIRVLHIVGSMNQGGVETWLMHVLRNIDSTRYQFDFCCLSGQPGKYAPEIIKLGGQVITPPRAAKDLTLSDLPWLSRWFYQLLQSSNYDVVHSHVYRFSGFMLWLASAAKVPHRIAHSHTKVNATPHSLFRIQYERAMLWLIRRYATRGIAASEDAAVGLFGPSWNEDPRWCVLYYGLDFSNFGRRGPNISRNDFGISSESLIVGHVGRFSKPKNHQFLLDVFQELIELTPDVYLLLVGDGELRLEVEKAIDARGIVDRVICTGVRNDVDSLMLDVMDVFILPSLWEGLGIVVVEAQAAGLRSVVSNQIPREAAIIDDAVTFLPLSSGPKLWAKQVFKAHRAGKLQPEDSLERVQTSRFSLSFHLSQLEYLYQASVNNTI